MKQIPLDAKTLSDIAIKGLQEKKGEEITRLNLQGLETAITSFFIICTGNSDRHVQALAESVMEFMGKNQEKPISKEGIQRGEWVVLDYASIVIHIFLREKRDFYRLEDLWGDAQIEKIPDSILENG
ncbi:MAG: ribosome silencing factor [Bacteroidota bacterium]